ncbi:MAG: YjbQ family protein [Deltaproteobacteria bacterium]|nr:YjbQ family protein [Deltaproteobacteria bacterium]
MPRTTFEISTTRRCELVDVTSKVQDAVRAAGLKSGLVVVYCPHTTAAITINENADPDVRTDLLMALERAVPNEGFRHSEGNSDAHTKTSLVGPSVTAIVEDGQTQLGTWQSIFFCEFDGPRRRKVWVQTVGA